ISPDDRMNLLYGFNWMRAGLLLPGKWSSSDREYFAQYQCWQGNYYICAGISYDDFYRRSKHWRITA
ncbi:MAG TPA: hypothetical protein VFU15_16925, partial [Bacteroidia bacterium]|nr:hypothetical protein [Bacteroidia bacterium]